MPEKRSEPRWLDATQQHHWRAYLVGTTLLMEQLDRDLRERHQLSLAEYEVLVRLSEAADHRVRMAVLAASLSHSRSRVTHTVGRLETAGLVRREACLSDGRGVEAVLTKEGLRRLEEAAPSHVSAVRDLLVDVASPEDLAAVGRVFDAVSDRLVSGSPEVDIR